MAAARRGLVVALALACPAAPALAQTAADDPAAASAMERSGRFEPAEQARRAALIAAREGHGAGSVEAADAMEALADNLFGQGRYAEAEPLYRATLDIRTAKLGGEDPALARSLAALAGIAQDAGRLDDATTLIRRSIAIREKALGRDHGETLRGWLAFASISEDAGRLELAEAVYDRVVIAFLTSGRKDDPDFAIALNNLGVNLIQQASGEARSGLRRPLALRQSVAPSPGSRIGPATGDPRLDKAWNALSEALLLRRRILRPDSPDIANSLSSLASLSVLLGQDGSAESYLREAAAIRAATLEPRHPDRIFGETALARLIVRRHRAERRIRLQRPGEASSAPEPDYRMVRRRAFADARAMLAGAGRSALARLDEYRDYDARSQRELRRFAPTFTGLVEADWRLDASRDMP